MWVQCQNVGEPNIRHKSEWINNRSVSYNPVVHLHVYLITLSYSLLVILKQDMMLDIGDVLYGDQQSDVIGNWKTCHTVSGNQYNYYRTNSIEAKVVGLFLIC